MQILHRRKYSTKIIFTTPTTKEDVYYSENLFLITWHCLTFELLLAARDPPVNFTGRWQHGRDNKIKQLKQLKMTKKNNDKFYRAVVTGWRQARSPLEKSQCSLLWL